MIAEVIKVNVFFSKSINKKTQRISNKSMKAKLTITVSRKNMF